MERLAGVGRHALAANDHPLARGAAGDLVRSAAPQEGYLALRGPAGFDPRRGVYQIWIFDATRDGRFPVGDGTFTVRAADATKVVPIRPARPVGRCCSP